MDPVNNQQDRVNHLLLDKSASSIYFDYCGSRIDPRLEQTDMSSETYFRIVHDALSDLSDCSVILILWDIRNGTDSPWFPKIAKIREEAMDYYKHYQDMAEAYLDGQN